MAGTKDGNKSRAVNPSTIKLNNDVYSRKIQSGLFCLRNSFNGPSFRTSARKILLLQQFFSLTHFSHSNKYNRFVMNNTNKKATTWIEQMVIKDQ